MKSQELYPPEIWVKWIDDTVESLMRFQDALILALAKATEEKIGEKIA